MAQIKHNLGYALGLALSLGISTSAYSSTIKLIASGYTGKGGEGIYSLNFDTQTNKFDSLTLRAKSNNPSFGLKNNNVWYFVDESADGQLLTYSTNEKGEFNLLQKNAVSGNSPCHIAKRGDGKYIAVSNYMSGNLSVFELDEKGIPKEKPQLKQHKGTGPDAKRQEGPHAHWAGWSQLPDNKKTTGLYVVDLGVDKIFWYPQNAKGQLEKAVVAYNATPGDGPRHMAFHPQKSWAYVVNELSNTISFTQQDAKGRLTEIQKISTLPAGFRGNNTAAHIAISADGKNLYTSNRGVINSIEVFNIGEDGRLTHAQSISSQGTIPRFFQLLDDEKKLILTNQESNNIVLMDVLADGKLQYISSQISMPNPTFVALQ